ncbi:MAG: hypothetical protein P8J42_04635 [Pseudomonadales bacterium]|nr:hypothetical protein [Pseudomonadales bacterium]
MNVIKDLPRFALFAIIAGVVLMILKQWVEFSPRYDQAVVDRQQAINESRVDVESIKY